MAAERVAPDASVRRTVVNIVVLVINVTVFLNALSAGHAAWAAITGLGSAAAAFSVRYQWPR